MAKRGGTRLTQVQSDMCGEEKWQERPGTSYFTQVGPNEYWYLLPCFADLSPSQVNSLGRDEKRSTKKMKIRCLTCGKEIAKHTIAECKGLGLADRPRAWYELGQKHAYQKGYRAGIRFIEKRTLITAKEIREWGNE